MSDTFVAAADGLVEDGVQESGIPLSDSLRHYLAITLARFMRDCPGLDRLTIRVLQAMDADAPTPALRRLADECLIATSLFRARLVHSGGSLGHYMGLGQSAYDAARMVEQAHSFPDMRDVIVAATDRGRGESLTSRIAAARAGSRMAREALAEDNIVAFPAPRWIV
ncbi:hypothetical protein [Maritimibacter fusiformis]|uniref:Uncharacterized protein n=1 Tax=Maritimibacter fusiformis TaxID=2603819 RepID=A0A5D0RN44_9RHOB|nr:hypothetical protein [Maritimibacter fusiformis]TYB82903.1 hypothetical protein FVF75_01585 [Maritimibacter fusiformis]